MEARDGDATELSGEVYNPGSDFKKDTKKSHVDVPVNDSTELWLIQCPIGQARPELFNGKVLINFDGDEQVGSITDPSGKSFELVTSASQEPDATLFMPYDSESKVVGKTLRRLCLVRYPEPSDFEKPKSRPSYRPGGTSSFLTPSKKAISKVTFGSSHATFTSAHSAQSSKHKYKRDRGSPTSSHQTEKHSSAYSGFGSHVTDISSGSAKLKAKKKKSVVELE